MNNNSVIEPTFFDLLNIFYQSGFPETLGPQATVVAHAIMYKWNSLYRPASFRMANKELENLSGIHFHIGRWRQKVCTHCQIDETPLFTYVSNGQKLAGTYTINTKIIPNKYQNNTKIIPNSSPESQRSEESKEREENNPPPLVHNTPVDNSNMFERIFGGGEYLIKEIVEEEQKRNDFRMEAELLCQEAGIETRGFFTDYPVRYIIDTIKRYKKNGYKHSGAIVNKIRDEENLYQWVRKREDEYQEDNK